MFLDQNRSIFDPFVIDFEQKSVKIEALKSFTGDFTPVLRMIIFCC